MAGAVPEESLMVGDNYEADILGAIHNGLDAICFNYHNEAISGDIKQVDFLLDLKRFL